MITSRRYDAVVIGAGAAGMAAACAICEAGFTVAVLDREEHPGGILLQCIHNGFGLHHFKRELTGPEYAEEYVDRIAALPVDIFLETTAVDFAAGREGKTVYAYSSRHGVLELKARAVVLAMGCRERNRGNIGIPGSRPSGIFTAGLAQRLLNIEGYVPGKRVVIVGSGDIGLIMARRLTWVGSRVRCVVEILPYPSGLTRNIVQCLQDHSIPLHLSHAVFPVNPGDRVESVEISPLENGMPVARRSFTVECDTVLLSVGLIPENELSLKAGVRLSPNTGGPVVDHDLQTNIDGVFACGNVLHVHDLVDFVSEEALRCGRAVISYLRGEKKAGEAAAAVTAGANVKYVIPNRCAVGRPARFLMRSLAVREKAELTVRQGDTVVRRRRLRRVRPAEMISLELTPEQTGSISENVPLEFSIGV
jgi:NADPH-dependent 2,4-dienoyl-CoA reductase/sulfur reductase-like enzyme